MLPKMWSDKKIQKDLLEYIASELKMKTMEDWYHITALQMREKGGRALLKLFQDSPSKLIVSVFPEHKWNLLHFHKAPRGTHHDGTLQREIMDNIARELNIKKMQEWYHVTARQIDEKGGAILLKKYRGSIYKLINSSFPHHKWDLSLIHI
eukprot:TRINITY_DN262_c0_g2_i2.p1 TRINITY_DN262_c0_g2~~TRINITY_DN262_c0_g2_i2.p1  ORF type:complete len:151 (-),score=29.45 TRINITY_DN262_c0_g2_i2:56-508(-)